MNWQLIEAFKPKIASVGDPFTIKYLIEMQNPSDLLVIMLNASPLLNNF